MKEMPIPALQIAETNVTEVTTEYCALGNRNCKRYEKLGVCTTPECPIVAKERRMAAKAAQPKSLIDLHADFIDVDMPFSLGELEEATSPIYLECLSQSGMPSPFLRRD